MQTVNKPLHRKSPSASPSSTPGISLADSSASFFTNIISKLHLFLNSNNTSSSPHLPSPSTTPCDFSTFNPHLTLKSAKFFQTALRSNLIPISSPSGFSKNVHLSLSPQSLTLSIGYSLPVNSTPFSKSLPFLHCSRNPPYTKIRSNCRPSSNLSLISKTIECVLKSHFTVHLIFNTGIKNIKLVYI